MNGTSYLSVRQLMQYLVNLLMPLGVGHIVSDPVQNMVHYFFIIEVAPKHIGIKVGGEQVSGCSS